MAFTHNFFRKIAGLWKITAILFVIFMMIKWNEVKNLNGGLLKFLTTKADFTVRASENNSQGISGNNDIGNTTTTSTPPVVSISSHRLQSPVTDKSIDSHGFWSDETAKYHHVFDENLSKALMKFFLNESVSTLIDLGAGLGNYSKQAMLLKIFTSCYDGNPKTIELSDGRCATVDLSKPIHFSQYDWVLSLEVGEHIPSEYEDTFIRNLDRVNKKGVIVSWAIPKQGGRGHVNERNNSYIIGKFENLGYVRDEKAQKTLRDAAKWYWFKNALMVFRKKTAF